MTAPRWRFNLVAAVVRARLTSGSLNSVPLALRLGIWQSIVMVKAVYEIETKEGCRRAKRYHFWVDHEFLRHAWTNFDEIAPGVFRSNHPTRNRLEAYAARGIKSVLTLRGGDAQPHQLLEVEACRQLGLAFHCVPMSASSAPTALQLNRAFEVFDTIKRPFLMHCKSGADRTGLLSAIYLIQYERTEIQVVKAQLSLRYSHIKRNKSGILDFFIEAYETRFQQTGIGIRDWIDTEYDPAQLTAEFMGHQKSLRFWQGWR